MTIYRQKWYYILMLAKCDLQIRMAFCEKQTKKKTRKQKLLVQLKPNVKPIISDIQSEHKTEHLKDIHLYLQH